MLTIAIVLEGLVAAFMSLTPADWIGYCLLIALAGACKSDHNCSQAATRMLSELSGLPRLRERERELRREGGNS